MARVGARPGAMSGKAEVAGGANHGRLVPWISWDEWAHVKRGLLGDAACGHSDEAGRRRCARAVRRVACWRCRGRVPLAVEATDYAKKSFETGTATLEKLAGVKTLDKAIEIQTDYVKTAFEGAVAQMTKMGELYAAIAKDAYKPFEGIVAKAVPATK